VNARRGSVLLEILLSIALFAGAAVFTLMALRNALAGTQRSAVRMRAVDLAASRMAEIERGIEGDEEATAADPDGLRMAVETEPSAFPGLVLTTVRVLGPAGEGTVAGEEREIFALRQLVRGERSPRVRRRRATRPARGFTLFEILVSVGLFGLLVFAMSSFLGDARRVRTRVAADVERNLAVAAIVGELAESIATCVTDEGGKGVRGTSTSIEVAFAGVPAWRIGTDEPAAALAPVDTLTLRFDAGDGRVEIGRDGAAATRGPIAFEAVRFRYLDGGTWRDEFDSTAEGRLPQAVELSIWFARSAPTPVERPEFDVGENEPLAPDRPADRRRLVSVPDADDSAEGGEP
jgi:type II secretory pathway component PulJ